MSPLTNKARASEKRESALDELLAKADSALCDELDDLSKLRLDYFIDPSISIVQHKKQFCINSDSAALALFIENGMAIRNRRVLEIGPNNGALMVYLDRLEPAYLCGIELQKQPAALARLNLSLFARSPHSVLTGSAIDTDAGEDTYDVVLCNPPYFELPKDREVEDLSSKELARFETELDPAQMIACASRHLKSNGRFCFVHRPDRLAEILSELEKASFAPYRVQIAYDARSAKACALLVEAIKEGTCAVRFEAPMWYDGSPHPKTGLTPMELYR